MKEYLLKEYMIGTGQSLDAKKDDINVKPVEKNHNKQRTDITVKDTNSNYNDGKSELSIEFIDKLLSYIDSVFPTQTELSSKVGSELRRYIKVGDGSELKRAKNKVRDVVFKEKMKMIDKLEKRLLSILVDPK